MTRSLFRSEALDFQKQHREFGKVGRLQAPSLKVFAWLLVIAVSSIIIFICIAGYNRKETVVGYLAPAMGTAEIFVPQQGTVTAVHVAEDQAVNEGDVLLTIDTSQITADGLDVNAAVLKSLSAAEDGALHSDRSREQGHKVGGGPPHGRRSPMAKRSSSLLTSQIGFQTSRSSSRRNSSTPRIRCRLRAISPSPKFTDARRLCSIAKQTLSSLRQRYTARQTELSQTRSSLQQLPTESARRLQPLRSELAQIDQRVAEVGGRRSFAVRAPIAGRVANLQATVGQIADPKRLQLDILPLESSAASRSLRADAGHRLRPASQKVRLLYDAFPFQRFGYLLRPRRQRIEDDPLRCRALGSGRIEGAGLQGDCRSSIDPTSTPTARKCRCKRGCCSEPTSCLRSAS